MSRLRKLADQYLSIRRALGWQLRETGHILHEFADFMALNRKTIITTKLAAKYSRLRKDGSQNSWARRYNAVRLFAQYCKSIDVRTEVPPLGLVPYKKQRSPPHIYSGQEVTSILLTARNLPSRTGWASVIYPTVLGLISATGLRISEATRMNLGDVDLKRGILTVRETKFYQSRHVPIHPSTCKEITLYLKLRERFHSRSKSTSLFLSSIGTGLASKSVQTAFVSISKQLGWRRTDGRRSPRIHDLRHTFAVNTLLRWYRERRNVEQYISLLSTYLGHAHPSHTYWYLSATAELLKLAANRLHLRTGDLL